MSDYKGSIGLIDGNRINLIGEIDPNLIKIDQIANALSKKCRFNGQCMDFYSVAEHCVHVAEYYLKNGTCSTALAGLLHDASEAYMSDLVTPLKVLFPEYIKLENKLQAVIAKKYDIPISLFDIVHNEIDHFASYIEIRQMGTHEWANEISIPKEYYFEIFNWDHNRARREYMRCYAYICHRLGRW